MTKKGDQRKELEEYINTLITNLKLDELPEKEKQEIIQRISIIAQNRIIQTILLSAKEEDIEELEKEIDNEAKPEEIYTKLADKIEGLDEKIQNTLSELYISLKDAVDNKSDK